MASEQPFSLKRRALGFRFAWRGLAVVARSQHNAWIHAGATVGVVGAGLLCHAGRLEWALLTLAMAGVWAAEAFNTAIEVLGNAVSAGAHPLVGVAKDVSAGEFL